MTPPRPRTYATDEAFRIAIEERVKASVAGRWHPGRWAWESGSGVAS